MLNQELQQQVLLLNEKLVTFFKYWMENQIQEGMSGNGELFTHVSTFPLGDRHRAFSVAWAMAAHDVHVVITASTAGYKIWRNLRTGNYMNYIDLESEKVLSLVP